MVDGGWRMVDGGRWMAEGACLGLVSGICGQTETPPRCARGPKAAFVPRHRAKAKPVAVHGPLAWAWAWARAWA